MRDKEFQQRPCEECGAPIYYPPQASSTVCVPCPNCGSRSCAN